MTRRESGLFWAAMLQKMRVDTAHNNGHNNFSWDSQQSVWPVVGRYSLVSFVLVNRCDEGIGPAARNCDSRSKIFRETLNKKGTTSSTAAVNISEVILSGPGLFPFGSLFIASLISTRFWGYIQISLDGVPFAANKSVRRELKELAGLFFGRRNDVSRVTAFAMSL